jgi:hypothetical protein
MNPMALKSMAKIRIKNLQGTMPMGPMMKIFMRHLNNLQKYRFSD